MTRNLSKPKALPMLVFFFDVHNEAIQATLEEIRKDVPKAAQAKPEDFVDLRFVNSLKQSGYLDRLWK